MARSPKRKKPRRVVDSDCFDTEPMSETEQVRVFTRELEAFLRRNCLEFSITRQSVLGAIEMAKIGLLRDWEAFDNKNGSEDDDLEPEGFSA